jgi:hypothetical protein
LKSERVLNVVEKAIGVVTILKRFGLKRTKSSGQADKEKLPGQGYL